MQMNRIGLLLGVLFGATVGIGPDGLDPHQVFEVGADRRQDIADALHEIAHVVRLVALPGLALFGVTTLLLFFLHGVYFVGLKTDGQVHHDSKEKTCRSVARTSSP